jgi:surfeit locus 1 family protein
VNSAASGDPGPAETERSVGAKLGWALVGLVLFSVFVALGTWQVQRREWKLDLIARVETRVHAPAVAAPGPAEWSGVTAANSEYRRVTVSGTFLNTAETSVQALTDLGSGYWVLTPLREADGTLVLINRGFVPPERRERAAHGATEAQMPGTVTGLLRISEPRGNFLRYNDPAHELWYSRDVRAIARARGLKGRVAPYFIDADAGGTSAWAGGLGVTTGAPAATDPRPVGGLTVIVFRNAHLSYAITWYALALLVVGAAWIVIREERRRAR